MSARLCATCKVIHKKPWDEKCKTYLAHLEKLKVTESAQTMATANTSNTTVVSGSPPQQEKDSTFAMCKELLSSVKEMNTRLSGYDKKVEELTARLNEKDNRDSRARHASGSVIREGALENGSQARDKSRDREARKSGVRPKSDSIIDTRDAPLRKY